MFLDPFAAVALGIDLSLLGLVYLIQDQETAPEFCASCHEKTDVKWCLDCGGRGEKRLGKDWVTCHHQSFILFPRILCLKCRQSS